jgi:CarboxypepD_reg-like domain
LKAYGKEVVYSNFFLLLASSSPAKDKLVSGTVAHASTTAPLVGVTISIPGAKIGAITGNNGQLSIEVLQNFITVNGSIVNFKSQTIGIISDEPLEIFLVADIK